MYLWTHAVNSHLAVDGHRSIKDTMHAQDGRLWGVDDGCAKQGAKHATVADGEGASIHVLNCKLVFTSLRRTKRIQILAIKVNGLITLIRDIKQL